MHLRSLFASSRIHPYKASTNSRVNMEQPVSFQCQHRCRNGVGPWLLALLFGLLLPAHHLCLKPSRREPKWQQPHHQTGTNILECVTQLSYALWIGYVYTQSYVIDW